MQCHKCVHLLNGNMCVVADYIYHERPSVAGDFDEPSRADKANISYTLFLLATIGLCPFQKRLNSNDDEAIQKLKNASYYREQSDQSEFADLDEHEDKVTPLPTRPRKKNAKFPSPDDIPDEVIKKFIVDLVSCKRCKSENLAERVFMFARYQYRGNDKKRMIDRIWSCIDELLEQKTLKNHITPKSSFIVLSDISQQ